MNEIIEYLLPKTNVSSIGSNFGAGAGNILIMFVILGVACAGIYLLLYTASSLQRYKRFKKFFLWLGSTFKYAGYGTLTVVVIGTPVLFAYWGFNYAVDNAEFSIEIFKWIGIFAGIFIGLAILGYATKNKIWKKLFKYHRELHPKPEPKKTEDKTIATID